MGSPHWDQDVNLPAEDPISGYKNLMYSLHFYAGTHKKLLRDRADEALAKGLPLFVSESAGMQATGNGPIDFDEWNKWINWMDTRQISWITWSVSDKDETCSVLNPSAASNGLCASSHGWAFELADRLCKARQESNRLRRNSSTVGRLPRLTRTTGA